MFYKEEDISNELICPKCTNRFVDPRFLPCGYSLCQMCILDQVDNQNKSINKCFCCNEKHRLPKEGEFIQNKFILKQLEKKPIEVKRGELGEQLKKSIKTLTEKKEELETYLKSGDQIVSDYLSEIRIQIDLITETRIDSLNKARENLLDKLKQYQTECMYCKRSNQIELLTKFDDFNEKMSKYLNGTDWNENFVNEKINDWKNLVNLCSKAKENFENEIFLNKKPVFTPFTALNDSDNIGKLYLGNFENVIAQNVISLNEQKSTLSNSSNPSSKNDNLSLISNLLKHKKLDEIYHLSDFKKFLIIKNMLNLFDAIFVLDIVNRGLDSFLDKYNKFILINTTFRNDYLFLFCQALTGQFHIFMCRFENEKSPKLLSCQGSNQKQLKDILVMAANDSHLYCFCKSNILAYKYDQNTIKHVNVDFTIPVAENAKKIKVDNNFFYILNESRFQKNIYSLYIYRLINGDRFTAINGPNFIDICLIEDGLIAGLYHGSPNIIPNLMIDVYEVTKKSITKKQSFNFLLQNSNVEFICFTKDKLLLLDKKPYI